MAGPAGFSFVFRALLAGPGRRIGGLYHNSRRKTSAPRARARQSIAMPPFTWIVAPVT